MTSLWTRVLGRVQCDISRLVVVTPGAGLGGNFSFTV